MRVELEETLIDMLSGEEEDEEVMLGDTIHSRILSGPYPSGPEVFTGMGDTDLDMEID